MLLRSCDRPLRDDEWLDWLADGRDFGQLVAAGRNGWPIVVPTHFCFGDGDEVLVHLAQANPLWAALESAPRVVLSVLDDYTYVPTSWRAGPSTLPQEGVPTSYYATVQLRCSAQIVDDPAEKADLLRRQLAHFQPDGDVAPISVDAGPYARLLPGIRGLRLHVVEVVAKFKFDDHKPVEYRTAVAARLQQRNQGRDRGARAQQLRRLRAAEQDLQAT